MVGTTYTGVLRTLFAAAAAGHSVVPGKPTRVATRMQVIAGKARALPPLCASCGGYNLHAGVVVEADDREGLERLGRYLLRPPLAQTRLEVQADGSVSLQMKRAYADGTQTLAFSAEDLVARLTTGVRPAEADPIVYRGVLAGSAALRTDVVAPARPKVRAPDLRGEAMAAAVGAGRSCGKGWAAGRPPPNGDFIRGSDEAPLL